MTTPTKSAAYIAALDNLRTAESDLQAARASGDTAATWNAEKNLLAAEDHANTERVATLTAHAKAALIDLENAVAHRALLAHAIYVSTGLFQGSLADFMRFISGAGTFRPVPFAAVFRGLMAAFFRPHYLMGQPPGEGLPLRVLAA